MIQEFHPLGIILRINENICHTKICMSVFQAVLFVIAKKRGKNKYPSAAEQICEMWYTHTVIYYLAIKKEKSIIMNNEMAQNTNLPTIESKKQTWQTETESWIQRVFCWLPNGRGIWGNG